MGNSNQSCNQCSCQSSPSSTRNSSKSYTDCCTETSCITIETTGNVGSGILEPQSNICVTGNVGPGTSEPEPKYNLCSTDSCNTGESRRAQRLANRRSRRRR